MFIMVIVKTILGKKLFCTIMTPALPPSPPSVHPPAPFHAIEDNDDTNNGDVSLHDDDEDDDDIGK